MQMLLSFMGKLHARTWNRSDYLHKFNLPKRSKIFCRRVPKLAGKLVKSKRYTGFTNLQPLRANLERCRKDYDYIDLAAVKSMGTRWEDAVPQASNLKYFVVSHGDLRLDNAFFDDEHHKARLIDWQICIVEHPAFEFTKLLLELNDKMGEVTVDNIRHLMAFYLHELSVERHRLYPQQPFAAPTVDEMMEMIPWGLVMSLCSYVLILGLRPNNASVIDELIAVYMTRLNKLFLLFPL
jgi:thiamine kinase-like enzyme